MLINFKILTVKKYFRFIFLDLEKFYLQMTKKSVLEARMRFAWSKVIKKAYFTDNYFSGVKSYEDQILYPLIFINVKKIGRYESLYIIIE